MQSIRARLSWAAIVFSAVVLILLSAPTFATIGDASESLAPAAQTLTTATTSQQGRVLPPIFQPKGISLRQMAKKTAFFNTGNRKGTPPKTPFQILYTSEANETNTFDVERGKFFYVPVIFNTNSEPVIGGAEKFPATQNRHAILNYFFGRKLLGVEYAEIVVDGVINSLASDYLVQVDAELADGGTRYQTIAAFISPLTKGTHAIEIRGKASGEALSEPPFNDFFPGGVFEFSLTYTVNVH